MSQYLILKLSDKENAVPFSDSEKLTERANGSWRFTPARLEDVKAVLLMFRGQILEEYELGDKIIYNRKTKRITFDLTPIKNSQLKGKLLNYPTANPASLLDDTKIQSLIIK